VSSSVTSDAASGDLVRAVGRSRDREVGAAGAVAFSVIVLAAAGGGVTAGSWPWLIGGLTLLAASLFLIAGVRSDVRGALLFASVFSALLVWTGLSALWSIDSDASLRELERDALYLAAFAAAFGFLRVGGAAAIGAGVAVGAGAVAGYSLVELAVGRGRTFIDSSVPSAPIGYANALAILSLLGAIASVSLAAFAGSSRERLAWLSLLGILCPTILLTGSRGTVLVAGVVVSMALILWLGPILRGRIRPAALAVGVLLAASIICGGAFLGRSQLARDDRVAYWRVAAQDLESHVAVGSGAGTYDAYWRHHPKAVQLIPLEAHSLYLETGAELGAVGLALLLATIALPLGSAIRNGSLSTLRHDPIRLGATCAYLAFVVHAAIDWDWEIPVVVVSGLYFATVLLGTDGKDPRPVLDGQSAGGGMPLRAGLTSRR
jgi:O-antigen ligase